FVTINLPGTYTLTVLNNQNGCTATDQVLVNENTSVPTSLEAVVTPPVCYGDRGTVEVTEVEGGQPPYIYSIDNGLTFNTSGFFAFVPSGDYTILIQDANGCEYEDFVSVPFVDELTVDLRLSANIEPIIELGESAQLLAVV